MDREKRGAVVIENLPEPFVDRLAYWLQRHGSQVLYGCMAIIAIFVMLYAWNARTAGFEEQDYLQAEIAYQEFAASSAEQGKVAAEDPAFIQLKEILERRPELSSRYNGLLAQNFLRLGDVKMALAYGQLALKNLSKENLPFYEDYSKTSLLIADGNYVDALKRSEFLSKKMMENLSKVGSSPQERGFGDALLIYNTLRIAMLNQKLGNADAELVAWQEVQRLGGEKANGKAASTPVTEAAFADALATFKTGKMSLNDYIEARKKLLRQ